MHLAGYFETCTSTFDNKVHHCRLLLVAISLWLAIHGQRRISKDDVTLIITFLVMSAVTRVIVCTGALDFPDFRDGVQVFLKNKNRIIFHLIFFCSSDILIH